MKRISTVYRCVFGLCGLISMFLMFQSCIEDTNKPFPVIKEELVGEYLAKDPQFSEFTRMLDTTGVMGLLKAYGIYTVFAPSNAAIQRYYGTLKDGNGEYTITSMNQLTLSEIREFCYNHIIKGDTLKTKTFKEGALGSRSMSERFLTVSFSDTAIVINGNSPIVTRDIQRHNGIIHVIGEALAPAHVKIGEVFEADSARFSIYIDALKLTGLYKMMNIARAEDETYDYKSGYQPNSDQHNPETKPTTRKFGYTILAVSDADLANYVDVAAGLPNGIHSLADLEKLARYYYQRAFDNDADGITDRTNRKHYLNRFISYHCFDRIILSSRFIKDLFTPHHNPQFPMPEYIETMLENTIVEVLYDQQGKVIGTMAADPKSSFGVFNYDDPSQGAMLTEVKDMPQGGSLNGYYHGITKPIMYNKTISNAFSSKRLRIDVATFLPELTTNNMRGSNPTALQSKKYRCWVLDDVYLDNLEGSPNTRFTYIGASEFWEDYQGDEYMVRGKYNFTVKTCPIPAGTYEVRMAFQATDQRGIAQLYFDSLPCGIPLDLAIKAENASIGYVSPGSNADDPDGFENDKMMHNRGYMKGPNTYHAPNTGGGYNATTVRMSNRCMRRVLGTYTFTKTEKHYFSAINLGGSVDKSDIQFMLDYLEFCPLEVLESEGID